MNPLLTKTKWLLPLLLICWVTPKINAQTLVMETGVVTTTHVSTTVSLNNTFVDPIVIATVPSFAGSHDIVVRIADVTIDEFKIFVEEPSNLDGSHTTETIHYIVVEKGSYAFPDGTRIEAGEVSSSNLSFQTVTLQQTYPATPAIFTQVQTDNSSTNFLKTRQRNSSTTNFQTKLEQQESLNTTSPSSSESIGYVAVSKGTGTIDGVDMEAGSFSLDEVAITHTFTNTYSSGNHFVASIATFNGGDPVAMRLNTLTTTVNMFLEEDQTSNTETDHTLETIDYLAIDDNSGAGIFLTSGLPVSFLSFDVSLVKRAHVSLDWVTLSETNNSHFTVERSEDGLSWEPLGDIEGQGNSSVKTTYHFLDQNPLVNTSYYRLKQIDFDGSFSYSPVKSVNLDQDETTVHIFPNPSNTTFQIDLPELPAYNNIEYSIYDIAGKVVQQGSLNHKNNLIHHQLEPATYFLKIQEHNLEFQEKIIVE